MRIKGQVIIEFIMAIIITISVLGILIFSLSTLEKELVEYSITIKEKTIIQNDLIAIEQKLIMKGYNSVPIEEYQIKNDTISKRIGEKIIEVERIISEKVELDEESI